MSLSAPRARAAASTPRTHAKAKRTRRGDGVNVIRNLLGSSSSSAMMFHSGAMIRPRRMAVGGYSLSAWPIKRGCPATLRLLAAPFPWRPGATLARRCTCGLQIVGKIRLALSPPTRPLLERHAVRHAARPDDVADSARNAGLRDRLRLPRPSPARPRRPRGPARRSRLKPQSVAAFYRQLWGALGSARPRRHDPREAQRGCRADPLRRDERHASYDRSTRTGTGGCSSSRTASSRSSARVSRKVQPRPLFLGRSGPRGDTLLRVASRRCIRAVFPVFPTASRATPTRTR